MTEALQMDPYNPEVYSTNASVLLSQSKPEIAKESLEKGMDLWYIEPEEDQAIVIDPSWPIFEARLALAKMLLEVESFERALSIIETCHVENDEDGQVWYLFAWAYLRMTEEDDVPLEEKASLREDAKECLEKILKVIL